MARHNNDIDEDEAMEWITDWEYERVSSSLQNQHHHPSPASSSISAHAQYGSRNLTSPSNIVLPTGHSQVAAAATSLAVPTDNVDEDHHHHHHDDDASMEPMDEDDDGILDADAPIPLDQADDPRHNDSSQEIAIFWTRESEELTDDDLNGMFAAHKNESKGSNRNQYYQYYEYHQQQQHQQQQSTSHPSNTGNNGGRRSSFSMEELGTAAAAAAAAAAASEAAAMKDTPALVARNSHHHLNGQDDEDENMLLGPLHDKEGLLPPMSDSQLYSQGNAQYQMIVSHHNPTHNNNSSSSSSSKASAGSTGVPKDSSGTHTTMDLTLEEDDNNAVSIQDPHDFHLDLEADDYQDDDDDNEVDEDNNEDLNHASINSTSSSDIFERQQRLQQPIFPEGPTSNYSASGRSNDSMTILSDNRRQHQHHHRHQEMKKRKPTATLSSSAGAIPPTATSSSSSIAATQNETDDAPSPEDDPIFARQRAIFNEMRAAEQAKQAKLAKQQQQQQQQQQQHQHYNVHQRTLQGYYSPLHTATAVGGVMSPNHFVSSPNSVTKTLTRAGMDSDEYQKVVTRLTEKNLLERQRLMLQESMKRSLESRQALHIKPTALPDYNHDNLTRVLRDIESSSKNISETYRR